MKILALGDVIGRPGAEALGNVLPELKRRYQPELVVVNGENTSPEPLFVCGADVVTGGNHSLNRWSESMLERCDGLIRPANLHPDAPGEGTFLFERMRHRVLVVSMMGNAFMEPYECPFRATERILAETDCDCVIVDFHAEATSEKAAFARHFDGRVSLVFGTHTHVPTADETVLADGTGFITDIGMCGPVDSVIGVRSELAIRKLMTKLPVRFENADGPCRIQGIVAEIDDRTKRTVKIERISHG